MYSTKSYHVTLDVCVLHMLLLTINPDLVMIYKLETFTVTSTQWIRVTTRGVRIYIIVIMNILTNKWNDSDTALHITNYNYQETFVRLVEAAGVRRGDNSYQLTRADYLNSLYTPRLQPVRYINMRNILWFIQYNTCSNMFKVSCSINLKELTENDGIWFNWSIGLI